MSIQTSFNQNEIADSEIIEWLRISYGYCKERG